MTHPRTALVSMLLVFFCLHPSLLGAQSNSASDLRDGLDQFRNGQYDKAILLFHNVILDPAADAQKPQAYLLIAKSYMVIGKLEDAEHNLEFYIANYASSPDYPEALYQKGRLLFMQEDYQNAVQSLQAFIAAYPQSTFVSSAWFWAGESLFNLGRLDDAMAVYQKIITDFPTSVKLEASQYKVSLIQLRKKELELTKLLKWSHEDFLKSVEEYQNQEKVYEQAVQAYQKRLAAASSEDDKKTIADLQKALAQKTAESKSLSAQLASLNAAAAAASTTAATAAAAATTTTTQQTNAQSAAQSALASAQAAQAAQAAQLAALQQLLTAKQEALTLKEKYLAWIELVGGNAK